MPHSFVSVFVTLSLTQTSSTLTQITIKFNDSAESADEEEETGRFNSTSVSLHSFVFCHFAHHPTRSKTIKR